MVHKPTVLNLGAHILSVHIGFSTVSVWSRFACLLLSNEPKPVLQNRV